MRASDGRAPRWIGSTWPASSAVRLASVKLGENKSRISDQRAGTQAADRRDLPPPGRPRRLFISGTQSIWRRRLRRQASRQRLRRALSERAFAHLEARARSGRSKTISLSNELAGSARARLAGQSGASRKGARRLEIEEGGRYIIIFGDYHHSFLFACVVPFNKHRHTRTLPDGYALETVARALTLVPLAKFVTRSHHPATTTFGSLLTQLTRLRPSSREPVRLAISQNI